MFTQFIRLQNILVMVWVVSIICVSSNSHSQNIQDVSTDDMLDYSLMRLQKSAQEVAQKNEYLKNDILKYYDKMSELSEELKFYRGERETLKETLMKLEEERNAENKSELLAKVSRQRLMEQLKDLYESEENLNKEIAQKQAQESILKNEIGELQRDITALRTSLSKMRDKTEDHPLIQEQSFLQNMLKEKNLSIVALESRVNRWRQEHAKPVNTMASLKAQLDSLQQKKKSLNQEMSVLIMQEKRIRTELSGVGDKLKQGVVILNEQKEKLISKKNELERVLNLAASKLKGADLNVESIKQKEAQLEENLAVMQRQFLKLNETYSTLEEKVIEQRVVQ